MGISVRIKLGMCDCGWACGGKCMKGDLGLTTYTCGAWWWGELGVVCLTDGMPH